MAAKKTEVDNDELLRLVKLIDEEGTNLTSPQIDFIANIIDNRQKKFTGAEANRIRSIYDLRVVNGTPEEDDE
jgi:hypothetical protein